MLEHNVYVVYVTDTDGIGWYATAKKVSASCNLVTYIKNNKCISLVVCKSWKAAEKLASKWNTDYKANGLNGEK